jgi:hypothetical protein
VAILSTRGTLAVVIAAALCLGLMARAAAASEPAKARLLGEPASEATRQMADWIVRSGDNHGRPFVIVDKAAAKVFVFRLDGQLRGAAPALLGLTRSDEAIPGIGSRRLATITAAERTTPPGRYVAYIGKDLTTDVLWIDYASALSLHRVITTGKDRRVERLATATPDDNRISYGCINVPARFYETVVLPAFDKTDGIVYILPESGTLEGIFPGYAAQTKAKPNN